MVWQWHRFFSTEAKRNWRRELEAEGWIELAEVAFNNAAVLGKTRYPNQEEILRGYALAIWSKSLLPNGVILKE